MRPTDLDAISGLLGDPAVMRYYPATMSRDEAAGWIEWNLRNYAEHGHGLWIIETLTGDFVGDCGLTWQDVRGVKELEVGYHVIPSMQGRGMATEAAAACRDFARDHALAKDLIAIIHPDNRASRRVAEHIGMRHADLVGADAESHRIVMRMAL